MSRNALTLNDLDNTGMLEPWIQKAKVPDLEHHLDNMRRTGHYAYLKGKVESLRGCKVRVVRDSVRIYHAR